MSNTSTLNVRQVADCKASEVAEALTRSFEGYIVPLSFNAEGYERRFRAEGLDPYASRVYFAGGAPVGVILIARRGWTCRVAAMGVATESRGRGLGRHIMREAIREAGARGDGAVVLEVIEQNTPAVKLYAGLGFAPKRRLVGYRLGPAGPLDEKSEPLSDLDPLAVARVVAAEGEDDLPWMLAAETLAALTRPVRGFGLRHYAYALVGATRSETVPLLAVIVPGQYRRMGWGARIVRALAAKFSGSALMISQTVPEELAPAFFERVGFERLTLTQLEMWLKLSSRR